MALTKWVQYFLRGPNKLRDNRIPPIIVDEEAMDSVILHAKEHGKDYPVDYVHASVDGKVKNIPFPDRFINAGEISAWEKRADGLYGLTTYTDRATNYINQKEFTHTSAEAYIDPKTNKLISVSGAALCNRPALHIRSVALTDEVDLNKPVSFEAIELNLAEIAKRKDVNPAEGIKEYGKVPFADHMNHKYPIDTPEHIRAAWSYINMPKNAAKYKPEEVAMIKQHIVAAWKDKIDKAGPPGAHNPEANHNHAANHAAGANNMSHLSQIAVLLGASEDESPEVLAEKGVGLLSALTTARDEIAAAVGLDGKTTPLAEIGAAVKAQLLANKPDMSGFIALSEHTTKLTEAEAKFTALSEQFKTAEAAVKLAAAEDAVRPYMTGKEVKITPAMKPFAVKLYQRSPEDFAEFVKGLGAAVALTEIVTGTPAVEEKPDQGAFIALAASKADPSIRLVEQPKGKE